MMNQQDFDAACIELRTQRRQLMNGIKNDRLVASHQLKIKLQQIQYYKDKVILEYREAICDLATSTSTRSAAFISGQAQARNHRDTLLADLDAQIHKLEEEFFEKSQQLRRHADKIAHDFDIRKAEIVSQYSKWLNAHKEEKARVQEKGGDA